MAASVPTQVFPTDGVLPAPPSSIRILVVDDDRVLREGCASVLEQSGYSVTAVGQAEEAQRLLQSRRWDVVLCDLYLNRLTGLQLLEVALKHSPEVLFVMMTGNPTLESSLEAIRLGAWDYLPKPFNAQHLQILIGRAAHATAVARKTQTMPKPSGAGAPDLLGNSPAYQRALELARRVAMTDASVMITGESGTGKERIAQFIHRNSRRASRPFVPVNCAALPEPLLESELFGHRKGAFTGADRDKPGLLETANGGTFLLDELGEAPLSIQAKLLRVIQDGVIRRVGSEQADTIIDVRFISATNRDPEAAVAQGLLRADLFYRLRVVPIHLPPLRERPEDIAGLATHFFAEYWARHRPGAAVPTLTERTLDELRSRPWKGNVRELQNVLEHAVVLLDPGQAVEPGDIPGGATAQAPAPAAERSADLFAMDFHSAKDALVARFERDYLSRLVSRAGANMSRAARLAGVDRTTLYRLMEKHGMTRDGLREGDDNG